MVITHADLEHGGRLSRLVRRGYAGQVYRFAVDCGWAAIVRGDAAHPPEEDVDFAAARGYGKHQTLLPLFDTADAEKTVAFLFRDLEHGCSVHLNGDASMRLVGPGTSSVCPHGNFG